MRRTVRTSCNLWRTFLGDLILMRHSQDFPHAPCVRQWGSMRAPHQLLTAVVQLPRLGGDLVML